MNSDERQVVISGCGVLTPLGDTADELFAALCSKKSAITANLPFDATGFTCRVAAPLPADADFTVGMRKDQVRYFRKNMKVMARDIQLAIGSSGRAISDAGLPAGDMKTDPVLPTIDHARFGIIYGSGFIPCELEEMSRCVQASLDQQRRIDMVKWGRDGLPLAFPLWMLKYLPNMHACHIGIIWDCQGPSNSVTCDAASGLLAAGEAFRHAARGTADILLSGGSESVVHPSTMLRHDLLGHVGGAYNDRPEAAHRPFDADSVGMVCGEASAAVMIEAADHAASRGAAARAVISGFGSTSAQSGINVAETSGAAISRAIRFALRDANLEPGDIDAVMTAGMGAADQETAESAGIAAALGGEVPVTCSSGGMGHVGAAQGAVDLAIACSMLHSDIVPAVTNCERLREGCNINVVRGDSLHRPLKHVLVLSAAIAGQAGAMILSKPQGH